MKTYGTYVRRKVKDTDFHGVTLNGEYDPSFFLSYHGYEFPGVEKFEDGDSLCDEISGRRLFRVTHSLDESTLAYYASLIPAEFDVRMMTDSEARATVASAYPENPDGSFLIAPAFEIAGTAVPALHLSI